MNNQPECENVSLDPIELPGFGGRRWSVQFDEPEISSDAGLAAVAASGVGDKLLASIAVLLPAAANRS